MIEEPPKAQFRGWVEKKTGHPVTDDFYCSKCGKKNKSWEVEYI